MTANDSTLTKLFPIGPRDRKLVRTGVIKCHGVIGSLKDTPSELGSSKAGEMGLRGEQ